MKFPIVIIIVLLSFCAGGAGAYFYFEKSAVASTGDTAKETVHEEEVAKQDELGDGHGAAAKNVYFKLDPLVLPVVNRHGVSQTVSMVVMVEVDSERSREVVKSNAPRLTDAYIQDMYGILNKHAALNGGVIHVSFLKKRLRNVTDKILGEDKYLDILIQVIEQRPL